MPIVENTHKIEHISCSSYCSFERCPFKYYLQNLEGFTRPEGNTVALDYGRIMHLCLPLCYEGSAANAIELFNTEWALTNYGNDDKVRNPITAACALRNFASMRSDRLRPYDLVKMPFSSVNKNEKEKISDYEVSFCLDIGGALPFVGRIDSPITFRADKSIWPMDYKTSREVSTRLLNSLSESPQAIGYALATSHLFNIDCKGTAYEVIRSSDKNQEVQFYPSYVKKFQIVEFMASLNDTSSKILEHNEKKNWPRKRTGCDSYSMYGIASYNCQYKLLCSVDNWMYASKYFARKEKFNLFESVGDE